MKRTMMNDEMDETIAKVMLVERTSVPLGVNLSTQAIKCNKADIMELAKEIKKADEFVQVTTCAQLKLIAKQIQFLQEEARKIMIKAVSYQHLHHVPCNFCKVPGNEYHLYKRQNQEYFSMLSPEEWGPNGIPAGHIFIGTFHLNKDMSWTRKSDLSLESVEYTKSKCDSNIVSQYCDEIMDIL